ncbi:MAG: DNA polymerase III subunit beta [Pseudomonadales bacterium]|nr:DNA polymerase III subunit beta [Pseudomonadales bacterium]
MKFDIDRDVLLEPLQFVSGVVKKEQTLPVLSNILVRCENGELELTATDQEVELCARITDFALYKEGETTLPARKLLDICKSLTTGSRISFEIENKWMAVESGRFSSHLAMLPATEFPDIDMERDSIGFGITSASFKALLDKTAFAMAQQDVRYFFNGMLFELDEKMVRTVATNGQRLAISSLEGEFSGLPADITQIIVPRKGIIELGRMLKDEDLPVEVIFTRNHIRVTSQTAMLTSKLIDGAYPDYQRAIPANSDKLVIADRKALREALTRTAILSNEMYRNVRLELMNDNVVLHANNPQQEEAEENVAVDYSGEMLEIGFNVGYLIDALGAIDGDTVHLAFSGGGNPVLITDPENDKSRFVISPMML